MVFKATFNNISVISWWPVLLVEETGVPGENSCDLESAHGEVYSIKHYVIQFVTDLRQVGGFLRVLWFPPTIKLATTI
jgi:hypothetical protein